VFIVGSPRSGTGLLRDLLRARSRLAFPSESHFLPAFWRAYGDPRSPREARALAARILRLRWVRAWQLERDAASFAHHRTFAGLVDDLYSTYAAREGAARWGDKTPQHALFMPVLLEIFSRARFVHIVRDARDVARSQVRLDFGPRNLYTAGRYWRRVVTTARSDGRRLGPSRYLEVRYESLVADREAVIREVLRFLGEDAADNLDLPAVDAARASSWRTEMPARDRDVVEAAAGDVLAELGYLSAAPPPTLSKARRLLERADHAARLAALRLRTTDREFWTTEREMRLAAVRGFVRRARRAR
jgi:hypothetical protein